jgi:riboflavin biosynthesis pyrimidine reductase
MRSLLPPEPRVDFGELASELMRSPAAGRRPYVACSFISTLDGRATVAGSTAALGFETDGRVLMRMRAFADAVLVGAGTIRVERYERILPVERLRAHREQIGLSPEPLTVLVSNRMDLPWESKLFSEGHGTVVVATTSSLDPPETSTEVEVRRYPERVDLADLLTYLHRERGVDSISCEGGPTLLHSLVADQLVDDLFLTHNPVLAGDGERSLMHGTLPAPLRGELVWVLEADEELFTRWRLSPSQGS